MITVVGYDGSPLPPEALKAVACATLVLGGERHVRAVDVPPQARTVVMGDVSAALAQLDDHSGPAVVLASGDPGFFGIVRLLRKRHGAELQVIPAVSSVAMACARAGIEWDDAVVVSAHGRDLRRAVNASRRFAKVAVLTAPGAGPRELARELCAEQRHELVVAERLGETDERITRLSALDAAQRDDWSDPSVVIALAAQAAKAQPGRRTFAGAQVAGDFGLADTAFRHRGSMVTKAEVRAYVVGRLAPAVGDLVWDIGAGSGSVGIECARRGAAIVLVERSAEACEDIVANCAAHDVPGRVVCADAETAVASLPAPDAVFIGGGGADVVAACLTRRPARAVVTLASVDRIPAVRDSLMSAGYAVEATMISASRLVPLPDGTSRLSATNPVTVLSGVLP